MLGSAKKYRERLVEDINSAKKTIKIFAGEATCLAYNEESVLQAFKQALDRGVKIEMIAGPLFSVDEKTKENGILDLAGKENFTLYFRPLRHRMSHFRIIDNNPDRFYGEWAHEAQAPLSKRKVIESDDPELWTEKLSYDFDKFIELGKAISSQDPKRDFLLLTPSKIQKVKEEAARLKKDIDYMTKEEIENLLS